MEKQTTSEIRVRRIIARNDVRLYDLLAHAAEIAGYQDAEEWHEWHLIAEGEWDAHVFQITLLNELFNVLFDTVDVFNLRALARKYHLPNRLVAKLVTQVFARISKDIDFIQAEHPDAVFVESRIWGLDGKVGYEFLVSKIGDTAWRSLI